MRPKIVEVKSKGRYFYALNQSSCTPAAGIPSPAIALAQGQFDVDDHDDTEWPEKTTSMTIEFRGDDGKICRALEHKLRGADIG